MDTIGLINQVSEVLFWFSVNWNFHPSELVCVCPRSRNHLI
jgi:hypothetical protein